MFVLPIAGSREPEPWLYITPCITHYITPARLSASAGAEFRATRERGACSPPVTHRQIDFLTTLFVILYARVSHAGITYRLVASSFFRGNLLPLSHPSCPQNGDKLSRLLCALHDPADVPDSFSRTMGTVTFSGDTVNILSGRLNPYPGFRASRSFSRLLREASSVCPIVYCQNMLLEYSNVVFWRT